MRFFSLRLIAAIVAGHLTRVAVHGADAPNSTTESAAPVFASSPLVDTRSTQHDFTSRINGRKYRVMISTPFRAEPDGKGYPVLYVLDGNWYFRAAADNISESAGAWRILPAIVVGVGYATDNNDDVSRERGHDLTLPGGPGNNASTDTRGGGDDFLRVLLEEVKPFVQSHYKVDETRQALYGKSLGGLMVLRALFRHPEAFQTYIAASPSIWQNDRAVLADEAVFSQRVREGQLKLRLLLTTAGNEQYRGLNPVKLLEAQRSRMVDNAAELAARLTPLNPAKLHVEYVNLADEDHVSVSLAALGRALTFALNP